MFAYNNGVLKRDNFELRCVESEAECHLTGYTVRNTYEAKTNDYDIRLQIMGHGTSMDKAQEDLDQKLLAFEGHSQKRVKPPTTGVKPRPMPF